jgi:HSP20 family molecular chaperone IbpA
MKPFISTQFLITLVLTGLISLTGCSKSKTTGTAVKTTSPPAQKTAAASPGNSLNPNSSSFADVGEKMHDLDARMDSIFANAFRGVGNWFDNSMVATSVDLREQNGNYVTRVYLPNSNTSKPDVKIDNGALHVVLNDERMINGKTEPEHFEQIINFPKPVESDKMRVERKQNLIVITVPKRTANTPIASASTTTPASAQASNGTTATTWEDTMFKDFARIQNQMDQAVRDVFPKNPSIGTATSQLESAVNVDDQKDKYVVHFYLPDRKTSNVSVNCKDGQLDLTANQQQNTSKQTASGRMQSSSSSRYEETITLPGPVKDKDMTVNRQAGAVVVTLPKA